MSHIGSAYSGWQRPFSHSFQVCWKPILLNSSFLVFWGLFFPCPSAFSEKNFNHEGNWWCFSSFLVFYLQLFAVLHGVPQSMAFHAVGCAISSSPLYYIHPLSLRSPSWTQLLYLVAPSQISLPIHMVPLTVSPRVKKKVFRLPLTKLFFFFFLIDWPWPTVIIPMSFMSGILMFVMFGAGNQGGMIVFAILYGFFSGGG